MLFRTHCAAMLAAIAVASTSCGRSREADPGPIRLVDLFKPEAVSGTPAGAQQTVPRTEWRFDGPAPEPAPAEFPATRGFEASASVQAFGIRDGRLTGRSTTDVPLVRVARTRDLDSPDQFHSIEIRMRASAGANLTVGLRGAGPVNLKDEENRMRGPLGTFSTPIVAGPEAKTYTLVTPVSTPMSRARQIVVRPTDTAGATFEIEYVRVVTRAEHLAGVPSGVGWQGLSEVFRELLVTRSPETMMFEVTLPERGWLDLAVGTVDDRPATFRVGIREAGSSGGETVLLDYTVTTPHRWERQPIDLSGFGRRTVQLTFSLAAEAPGIPGFWGTPVVRTRAAAAEGAPQGIIVIQADTLRPDHLPVYGHTRETTPFLAQLASEGTVFQNAYAQAGWTKVSTPSIMTGLYPSTHGVAKLDDRLPASATTLAEVYRAAGHATLSLSSVMFTGQFTNLHQGFEELHEASSTGDPGPYASKTARDYVDRAIAWIERHRDEPFFIYLHVFDPHSPYEPRRPYDTLWADISMRDEHIRQREALRKTIAAPFLAGRGMATREEMIKAEVDPARYIAYDKDWYDSSIRGMDAEIARLMQRLRTAGLDNKTAVVFLSDHGEEFHEHGRMWHGQSVYTEMMRVPLIVRWPGQVQARRIEEPVQLIDVMPTLLDISRLSHPEGLQGQSLLPLLRVNGNRGPETAAANDGWRPRPVVMEKRPEGSPEFPNATESAAIIDGHWKLIHNTIRPAHLAEFELFDVAKDPFDQNNLADQHPDVVKRLAKALEGFRGMASGAKLKPDSEAAGSMTPEQLQRLRSLGYIK
jgi:arylsulfatase A-like enzyme